MAKLLGILRSGLLAGGLGVLALSCATNAYRGIDDAVDWNDFQTGIEIIIKGQEAQKPLYPESNSISLFLDKGMLEHYAGNYAQSARDLQEAERLIEEAFTKSISAEILSYIANDNTKDYAGEDFEDIYINVFNALNYYNQGNLEAAMVEIRKLVWSSGKLDMLSRKYEDSDKKLRDGLLIQLNKLGRVNASPPRRQPMAFYNSALAQYLSALFFLANGNEDSARIAFEAVGNAFAANANVYNHPIPAAVTEARDIPAGMARLNVIAFAGLSPVKEQRIFRQDWPYMRNPSLKHPYLKLPVMVDRDSGNYRVSVTVNGETFELELIEDMGAVAKETFHAKYANVFFKTWFRVLLKFAATDIAAEKLIGIARTTTIAAALLATDLSEGADIRMGRYFPSKAYIGGINLEPGTYPVTISFSSGARREGVVEVKAGNINLIDVVSLTPNDRTVMALAGAAVAGTAIVTPQDREDTPPVIVAQITQEEDDASPAIDQIAQEEDDTSPAIAQATEEEEEAKLHEDEWQQPETERRVPAPDSTPEQDDEWKNKIVYLGWGGALGGYSDSHFFGYRSKWPYDYGNYYVKGWILAYGIIADFPLLKFFSIETGLLIVGYFNTYANELTLRVPVVPILGKLGGRFDQIELSFNMGYTIGEGFTLGGTFGVHAGAGIIFAELFGIPSSSASQVDSATFIFIGYKLGMGNRN